MTKPSRSKACTVFKHTALFSSVMIFVLPVPMQLNPPEFLKHSMNSSVISIV
ncbi:Uncharacterised protein [Chlamydia abortus]|nr:Uncharacterised protein [Chlamydia abortus]